MQIDNLYFARKIVEILDVKCNANDYDNKGNWENFQNGKGEYVGIYIQKLIDKSKQFIKNSKMKTLEIKIGKENCLLAEIPFRSAINIRQLGKNAIKFWLSKYAEYSDSECHEYSDYKHLELIGCLHRIRNNQVLPLGTDKVLFDLQMEKITWDVPFKETLLFKIIEK